MIFFSLAVVGCALDLLTKHWIFQWRGMPKLDNEWWIWEGYIGIETALKAWASKTPQAKLSGVVETPVNLVTRT